MTKVEKLTTRAAKQIPRLINKVFGDSYSDELFYSPDALLKSHEDDEYLSYVASDDEEQLQAFLSVSLDYRPRLARIELLMSDPSLPVRTRAVSIAKLIGVFRREIGQLRTRGFDGVLSMETTAHDLTQKLALRTGFIPCGMYLGFLPPGAWRTSADRNERASLRMSATLSILWIEKLRQPYVVHVPRVFAEVVNSIYAGCRLPVSAPLDEQRPNRAGECELREFIDRRWSRVLIRMAHVGEDCCTCVIKALDRYKKEMIDLIHFVLPLTNGDISDIVDVLLANGCKFAAVIPGYGPIGEDVLILQYLNGIRYNDGCERIYSALSQRIFELMKS